MAVARKKPPRPARGRPKGSACRDVREDILNSAERLFAIQGFAATAVHEVARDAGVTPAMAHYYFGSKQSLLAAVMDRTLEPLAGGVSRLGQQGQVSLASVTALMLSTVAEHPFLPQLLAREVLLPGGRMQQRFIEHFAPRLGGRLPGILAGEQRAGRLSRDFDPAVATLLILSLCLFPFIARPAAERALGIAYDRAGLQRLSRHVNRLLQRGLEA